MKSVVLSENEKIGEKKKMKMKMKMTFSFAERARNSEKNVGIRSNMLNIHSFRSNEIMQMNYFKTAIKMSNFTKIAADTSHTVTNCDGKREREKELCKIENIIFILFISFGIWFAFGHHIS